MVEAAEEVGDRGLEALEVAVGTTASVSPSLAAGSR
jgi:hypothetical protein